MAVNFDPQIITLFKEVRKVTIMAKDVKRVYPHAVSVVETVRPYGQTL